MSSLRFAWIAIPSLLLPACGGCGDDTAAEPDAEVQPDSEDVPDAEVPDAEVPDAEPDPAPSPVAGFTAAAGDPVEVDLAWTNPADADLAGVLVVTSTSPIAFTPTDGTTYTAAQDLGSGQTVVFAGAGAAATLTPATLGQLYYFKAWAFDDATQYSIDSSAAGAYSALPAQTATISITLAGVVTVDTQPANLTLSGANVVYNNPSDTLNVDLTIRNDTARLLFNLKALEGAQNQGGSSDAVFPATGGVPYLYFGPQALDVGDSATRTLHLTGITGATDPITVALSFVDAPMLFTSGSQGQLVGGDTAGSGHNSDTIDLDSGGGGRQGAVSRDGKFVYFGDKTTPGIITVDTRTFTQTLGINLGDAANGLGNVGGLALSPDGTRIYAIVNDGTDWNGGNFSNDGSQRTALTTDTEVQVVALDASDLSELSRVTIYSADATHRVGRNVVVSPDGRRAGIVLSSSFGGANELWLIDLATFAAIDTDPATAGTQPVALDSTGTGRAMYAVWEDTSIYVAYSNHGQHIGTDNGVHDVSVVNDTSYAVSSITTPVTAGDNASTFAVRGGKLYYPSKRGAGTEGFHVNDGTTVVAPTTFANGDGVVFDPGGSRYYVLDDGADVYVMDASTDTPIDTDGNAGNGATAFNLGRSGSHLFVISPF